MNRVFYCSSFHLSPSRPVDLAPGRRDQQASPDHGKMKGPIFSPTRPLSDRGAFAGTV